MENAALAPTQCSASLSAFSPDDLAAANELEKLVGSVPQVDVSTEHLFHGGMYARTIRVPAGVVFTGVLIKIPTLLVVCGKADLLSGDGWTAIDGFAVLAGSAFRKQVCVTRSAVEMTMIFPTQAKTVEEAEHAFTGEYESLSSHNSLSDTITVTGE